jgi:autotransporter strand-loop-strand O-heptosyltransferase
MKILFIAPHLSTGGMPQFLLKRIQALKKYTNHEVSVIEFNSISREYVVQRRGIISEVGYTGFYTLGDDKMEIFGSIEGIDPDIIHIEGVMAELSPAVCAKLLDNNRKYRIVETCHDVIFDPTDRIYNPDGYAMCSPFHLQTFAANPGYKEVIQYPYDSPAGLNKEATQYALGFNPGKRHVLNVGLWTKGKNQGEAVELARSYPEIDFHFVGNMAINFQDYWKPIIDGHLPDNVFIHGERYDLDVFYKACDIFMLNSVNECSPIVLREAITHELPIVARNLPQYGDMYTPYITPYTDNLKEVFDKVLLTRPIYLRPKYTSVDFADKLSVFYARVSMLDVVPTNLDSYEILHSFMGKPTVEITGNSTSVFTVEFWEGLNLIHKADITTNHWTCANREYYVEWNVKVYKDGELVSDSILDLKGQTVLIVHDSKSLGDTIAWMPYALEFKNKHNCNVIVTTYHNYLFKEVYPELTFTEPRRSVDGVNAMYKLGWFYDGDMEPELPNTIPLQQAACNILGLDYKEIVPRIHMPRAHYKHEKKYVAIATRSTAGCKHWDDAYWQDVINHLVRNGYDVINTSMESTHYENCYNMEDKSMNVTMGIIKGCEFFIGLSSGLSWVAWGLEKPVIMISNFTKSDHEFGCIRPTDTTVCHGCWNNKNFKFDKSDWNWCPIHKGTDRQFECQRFITPPMIIKEIEVMVANLHLK